MIKAIDEELLPIVGKVATYLGEPLPTKHLAGNLIGLEATRLELAEKRVDWLHKLHKAEMKVLHPKDPQLTELDRKTSLQAYTADIRRDYELLLSLEELVKYRLDFGRELIHSVDTN